MSEGGPDEVDTSGKLGSKYQDQEKWLNTLVREHGLYGAATIVGLIPGGQPIAVALAVLDRFDKEPEKSGISLKLPSSSTQSLAEFVDDHGLFAATQILNLIPVSKLAPTVFEAVDRIKEEILSAKGGHDQDSSPDLSIDNLIRDHGLFSAEKIIGMIPKGKYIEAAFSVLDRFDHTKRKGSVKSGSPIPYPHINLDKGEPTIPPPHIGLAEENTPETRQSSSGLGQNTKQEPDVAGNDTLPPGAKKFVKDASQPGDDVEEIMLKDPSEWSGNEARKVQGRVGIMATNHPERDHLDQAVREFYDLHYGTDEVERDATGRRIEPEARGTIPDKPSPLQTPEGEDLDEAARRVSEKIAKHASNDGATVPVRELQAGLNLINTDAIPRRQPLKTDGTFGPKTRSRFRRTLAQSGRGKIEEGLALGKFRTLVEQARKAGDAPDLKEQTKTTFGPLFRSFDDPGNEKIEAVTLQETLNDLSGGRVERLKVDGKIGPKTRNAFQLVSKINDPDEVSKRLGQMLGFLD